MYKHHLFICTNGNGQSPDPNSPKPRCGWKNSEELRKKVKELSAQKFGKSIRINSSGCLGACEKGIACVLYPEAQWFFNLNSEDDQVLINAIQKVSD